MPRGEPAPSGDPIDHDGTGPAVLMVHGFTSTPWELRPLADALADRGCTLSAPLLPGHGTSPAELARARWDDWALAVDAAVRRMIRARGRVVLVGSSLGGLLAVQAAVRHQDAGVAGVVTLACPLRLSRLNARVIAAAQTLGRYLPDLRVPKWRGSDVQDPLARAANPGYRTQPLRSAREIAVGQRVVRGALPALRVPLLAVHGLRDRTAPVAASIELVRGAGTTDATLVVLPRSGHLLGVDVEREELARQVCAFVTRVAPRRAAAPLP